MPGLINNVLGTINTNTMADGSQIATTGSVGVDPERRSVDAAKETVSGQLDALLAKGSPLIDRSRAGAMQTANKRGLINSSMAAGAGEAAAIDAAMPIATADAQTYTTAARDNQSVGNAALQYNADAVNKTATNNADAFNKSSQLAQAGRQDQALATLRGKIDTGLQELKGTQSAELASIEADYKTLMQTSQSATDVYKQSLDAISKVIGDVNMNAATKATAINGYLGWMKSNLTLLGSINGVDLTKLLNFNNVTA